MADAYTIAVPDILLKNYNFTRKIPVVNGRISTNDIDKLEDFKQSVDLFAPDHDERLAVYCLLFQALQHHVNHGAPELAASAPTAAPAAAPAAMIHPSIVPTGFVASGGIEEKLDRVLTAIADIKKEVASIKEGSDGPQIDVSSMSADLGVLSKAYLTKRHYAICKHNLHNPLNWKPLPHLETGKLRPDDSTIYFEDMGDLLIGSEAQTISKWLKFYGLDSAAAHYGHHRLERDRVTLLSYFTKTSDPALDPSRSFVVVG